MERHLLLVDDEPNVLSALRRCLRREPYTTFQASNGEEALQVLEHYPIDVVISDQRMPMMSGAELLDRIRERWPHTVRLMLSGYNEGQTEVENRYCGAAWKFLFKPWEDEVLRNTLRLAFERVETQSVTRSMQEELSRTRQQAAQLSERLHEDAMKLGLLEQRLDIMQQGLGCLPQPCLMVEYGQIRFANAAACLHFESLGTSLVGLDIETLLSDPEWEKIEGVGDLPSFMLVHQPAATRP